MPQPRRADQPRMRSSIACARCRRSKVKCLNNGINTPCRACVTSGRDCIYPAPTSTDRSHRRDGSFGRAGEISGNQDARLGRLKPRKLQSMYHGSHSSIRAPVDALNSSVVTALVWLELFDIWQHHFSIDLPFLHPTGFTSLLREAKTASMLQDFNAPRTDNSDDLPAIPQELLLAFLALTSRFHPVLITHHAPASGDRPGNPQIATEYYAAVCRDRLIGLSDTLPDLARVQSLLMLAYHELGDGQGVRAWTYLGEAIRFARMLGYGIPKTDDVPASLVQRVSVISSAFTQAAEDVLQEQETQRRTFWACFILERHLSSGLFRPLSIQIRDARIPLPVSDKSYTFNEKVKTPYLADWIEEIDIANGTHQSESGGSPRGRENYENCIWETGSGEGALSRYVKASELFSSVLHWVGKGGRLTEQSPPWDPQSAWYKLNRSVNVLIEKLPRDLTLSPANISAHIQTRSPLSFTLLHTSLLLSKMMLHREFLPFLPLTVSQPKGPSDNLSPFSSKALPDSAQTFWSDSSIELFKSSRDLFNLFQTCNEWKTLPETPLVVFASYMIAMLGIYTAHFPWMDISSSQQARITDTGRGAAELVSSFIPRFRMADGWFKTIGRIHHLFSRTKKDLQRHHRSSIYSSSERQNGSPYPSLRLANEDYAQLDNILGSEDTSYRDQEMPDAIDYRSSTQVNRGQAETVARQTWESISNQAGTEIDGLPIHHQGQGQQSPSASRSSYPPISPHIASQPYTPNSLPQFPYSSAYATTAANTGAAANGPEKTDTSATAQSNSQPWTQEKLDQWLASLETVFGANDVIAFVEGTDWTQYNAPASPIKGWMKLVWS